MVFILSFKKYTPTPLDNNSCVYLILSNVLLENLDISLVKIKSNLCLLASSIILKNSSRFLTCVPDIPSSIYEPINSQLGTLLI